ncbi:Cas9 inhibitor AcrIIA9 family protein [Chryseobacterium sp. R2A-55]|uniref:Cas9 inhibitor AcrIIA9 family protein n=1 Tax=Chryseobacterium sp. R2A-55 TaxID=2744445 RepID=UPI001F46264B|nr:Cas9 inhibitor AcrIIA9 family protein [Chryseobacterium sp. R2A-55]
MKASNAFEKAIQDYIEQAKSANQKLLEALKNEKKTLTDCCNFILGKVKEMKVNALTNDEVFAIAEAYYLDEKVTKTASHKCNVVVSTVGSAAPKLASKKKAVDKKVDDGQMSIFDLL